MRSLVEAGVRIRARQDATPLDKASAATVTRNGRITIPAGVRRALHLAAGDRVEFVETAPGRFEFIAANRSVTELKGLFGKQAVSVTIEDMNLAVAKRGASSPWSLWKSARPAASGTFKHHRHPRCASGVVEMFNLAFLPVFALLLLMFFVSGCVFGFSGAGLLLWTFAGAIGTLSWACLHERVHGAQRLREREARRRAGISNCPFP